MIRSLHSLRFVFAIFIVASHMVGEAFDFGGDCGVSFFFMLSGFVLSVGYAERMCKGLFNQRSFCLKQLLKFYPLHIVTLSIMVILDIRLDQELEWYRLLPSILLLQSWIPKGDFYFVANGPAWFLSDIFFFYIVFHLLFQRLFRLSLKCLIRNFVTFGVLYPMFAFTIPSDAINSFLYIFPLTRVIDFAIGILLYRFYVSAKGGKVRLWLSKQNISIITFMECLMIIGIVILFYIYRECPVPLRCACLFWCFLPFFICFFADTEQCSGFITKKILQHPIMLWLGSISFEVYMLHAVLIRVGNSLYSEGVNAGFGIFFIIILISVSWVVKKFFSDKMYLSLVMYINKNECKNN